MDHLTNRSEEFVEDTIAAISTPAGEGGIGVIRLSGSNAIAIAIALFRRISGGQLTHPQSCRQYYGHIVDAHTEQVIDEVLLCVMRGPHSYTREDVVEISGHGGMVPLQRILQLVCRHGARLAAPGEFTQRAFLNGRIDLTQAEAVLDTIRARTDAGLRSAQRHLQGDIARCINALRERLISLLASLEAAIDFADDDLTFLTADEIDAEISALAADIQRLITSYHQGRLLREGANTAIIGRPNTGKSSLLNALLGEERAIVTAIPGTTRDVIEEYINIDGVPLKLLDTAGIRETTDTVEMIGVERSRTSLQQADLILLVLDQSQPLTEEDAGLLADTRNRPVLVILNKADLPAAISAVDIAHLSTAPSIAISAMTGDGLAQLRAEIRRMLTGGDVQVETTMLATLRQRDAAVRAVSALERAQATLHAGGSEELLAVDVMAAATALGEITGHDIHEDMLNDLFSRFCVGK